MLHFESGVWTPLASPKARAFLLLLAAFLAGCASKPMLLLSDPLAALNRSSRTTQSLMRAQAAWSRLAVARTDAEQRSALVEYSGATRDFVKVLAATSPVRDWRGERLLGKSSSAVRLRFDPGDSRTMSSPADYESIAPIKKLLHNPAVPEATQEGLGVPVLAKVRSELRHGKRAPGYPESGQFSPMTAWIEFQSAPRHGEPSRATLRFADPRELKSIAIGGQSYALAKDIATTARARLGDGNFLSIALRGLFRPEQFLQKRGVYLSGAYRADKIPIILTHGLLSDPHIWENLTAAILADPVLGARCQVWYFIYPTGAAVPMSAAAFRKKLAEVRRYYDPEGRDVGQRNIVLIGHSMGGLLSRMLTIDSKEDFRAAYFVKPLEEVRMNDELRAEARDMLYFQRTPGVQRAIFIATPHEGSGIVSSFVRRVAYWFVRLPQRTLRATLEISTFNLAALNPKLRAFRNLGSTSIDTLAADHPYFKALAARPIGVPFHSIIGDRGKDGPLAESSDGAVPYASSHVPGATSEKIVPHNHSCVEKPETIAEVLRILRSHVQRGGDKRR